jgi:hypothetical protein
VGRDGYDQTQNVVGERPSSSRVCHGCGRLCCDNHIAMVRIFRWRHRRPEWPRIFGTLGCRFDLAVWSQGTYPGSREWGYLITICAITVATVAVALAVMRVMARNRKTCMSSLPPLILVAGSLILLTLARFESETKVRFGDGPPLNAGIGSVLGLLLAVLATLSASVGVIFAWATRYPWLWGPE